ncbi:MAG: dienelactone hydrolase family protein [Gemmatimonadales bacterium]
MTDATANAHVTRAVPIPAAGVWLPGDLTLPPRSHGLVIFAHGSGSSRLSPRNRQVAHWLHEKGFGTLLFDLLTEREEVVDAVTGTLRFAIDFLASRLIQATDWVATRADTRSLRLGYFGASTGAAAALVAAAEYPARIDAVVSRGGRPDLAGSYLARVAAPTLLIVGGADAPVIEVNRAALARLAAPVKELIIVPGATHLFEEPGTLERVADLAGGWFTRHLLT